MTIRQMTWFDAGQYNNIDEITILTKANNIDES